MAQKTRNTPGKKSYLQPGDVMTPDGAPDMEQDDAPFCAKPESEPDEATGDKGAPEDKELIEMLEHLNQTLDSAQVALLENPDIAVLKGAVQEGHEPLMPAQEPGAPAPGSGVSPLQSPASPASPTSPASPASPTSPTSPASVAGVQAAEMRSQQAMGRGRMSSAIAVTFGVFLGVVALGLVWPVWQSSLLTNSHEVSKDKTRLNETIIVREAVTHTEGAVNRPDQPGQSVVLPFQSPALPQKQDIAEAARPPPAEPGAIKSEPAPEQEPAVVAAISPPASEVPASETEPATRAIDSAPVALLHKAELPDPLSKEEESRLMQRGLGLMQARDVASARLIYEHGARRGSSNAMFAMAQTYDPDFLAQQSVVGIKPDIAAALDWYGRAARSGHDSADVRAAELEGRAQN